MQIPLYNQQINVGGGAPLPRAEGNPVSPSIGQALQNVGQGLQQVGQGITTQETVEAKILREQAEQNAKVRAGNDDAQDYSHWSQWMKDSQASAVGGATGYTQTFLDAFKKYQDDSLSNTQTPLERQYRQQSLNSLFKQLAPQAIAFEANATKNDRVNTTKNTIDTWINFVNREPTKVGIALNSIVQTMPDVGPELRNKLLEYAHKELPYSAASGALEHAAQAGDISAIRTLRERIAGEHGDMLDPAKRSALITKAYGYENGIQAAGDRAQEKAIREQQAREDKAGDAYKAASDLALSGRYLSLDYISQLSDIAAGTGYAPAVQELVKSQGELARFASLSSPVRKAELERMRAPGATKGQGTDPATQSLLDRMDRMDAAIDSDAKQNPWKAAQERGVIERAPLVQITDVPSAQQLVAQRMGAINVVERWTGRRESPLQPEEAQQTGKIIRALPLDQQASALGSLGASAGNMDRVSDLAKQMGDKDKTLGMAMAYANSHTTTGRLTSEWILKGEQALRDGIVKIDNMKETGWRAEIAEKIRGAGATKEVEDQWIDAAYLIKTGLTASGDTKDGIKYAVNLATGGIITKNGSKIPLPYGMQEDTFDDRIAAIKAADLAPQVPGGVVYSGKTAIPLAQFVSQLPKASLMHAGQGRYAIRAGTGLVMTDPSNPKSYLILEIKP
ncbi:hypothetical protein [Cupriavidus sp. CuC1]|uniref:hypothetical protein n=1 Tax=Cupriavidus sp. CuC1 TaxID=3373131 RepID=UPI0037D967B7